MRGIRKAQIKLASTYMLSGEVALAKEIHERMSEDPLERLQRIYMELHLVESIRSQPGEKICVEQIHRAQPYLNAAVVRCDRIRVCPVQSGHAFLEPPAA